MKWCAPSRRSRRDGRDVVGEHEDLRAFRIETRPRHDEYPRESGERGVAFGNGRVPRRIADLGPLVGPHHDDVVARGDVGDQLRVGDHDAQLRTRRGEPFQRGDATLEPTPIFLRECDAREREVEAIEPSRGDRGFGDRDVRDGRRIERAREDARSHPRRIAGCKRSAPPRR